MIVIAKRRPRTYRKFIDLIVTLTRSTWRAFPLVYRPYVILFKWINVDALDLC